MKVLGIETSSSVGSVALLDGDNVADEITFERGMIHGRELTPSIQNICERNSVKLNEISLIGVDIGPGSYTGLRVGLATAKGLVYALNKIGAQTALVGVSSLEAMAENVTSGSEKYLCPVIDARWNQVYSCIYKVEGGKKMLVKEWGAYLPEELATALPKGTLIFGDGLKNYGELFHRDGVRFGDEELWRPCAARVAGIALRLYRAGKRDNPFTLVPLYLRPTEAEMKFGKAIK